MTTLACPPAPMTTTGSGFMGLEDRPLAGSGPDEYEFGRRQLTRPLNRQLPPSAGLLIDGKYRKALGEETAEPVGRADSGAPQMMHPVLDDQHDAGMSG